MITYREIDPDSLSITKDTGYYYFCDTEHPLATGNSSRVYWHRHLASLKYGRWLTSVEHVHHIDRDKLNNTLDNLEVCTASEHAKIHKPSAPLIEVSCKTCGNTFSTDVPSNFCSQKCRSINNIKNISITKELLEETMPYHTWVSLGVLFNYSDNGIKKRAKSLGADLTLIRTRLGR